MSKVLIIDDEHSIALSIKLILGKHGIESDVAFNLIEGLFKACHYPYDAVILDNMFPEMITGSEVETVLSQVNIPTVMFTASENKDLKGVKTKIIQKHKGGITELIQEVKRMCVESNNQTEDEKWIARRTKQLLKQ